MRLKTLGIFVVYRHETLGLKRGERKRRREKHFDKILDKKWR